MTIMTPTTVEMTSCDEEVSLMEMFLMMMKDLRSRSRHRLEDTNQDLRPEQPILANENTPQNQR